MSAFAISPARWLCRPASSAMIHSDPIAEKFENWANAHLADDFLLGDAAKSIGTNKRTLARRLQAALGKTPLWYLQSLRIERAVHLLKTTDESVEEIAARVAYAEGVTLRTLLRRKLGRGVSEIRHDSGTGSQSRLAPEPPAAAAWHDSFPSTAAPCPGESL